MTDKHKSREQQMVVIERDEKGVPTIWCDPEVATIVAALNSGGVRTVASCSGHGVRPGAVALADGRELVIAKDYAEARIIEGHFPGINGEQSRLEAARAADKARIAELTKDRDDCADARIHYAGKLGEALGKLSLANDRVAALEKLLNEAACRMALTGFEPGLCESMFAALAQQGKEGGV